MLRLAKALLALGLIVGLGLGLGLWWWLGKGQAPAPPGPPATPVAPASSKPKLAIVIDDWGNQSKPIAALAGLGPPITVAVIPGLGYSRKAAETAHGLGLEVIVHLPMQPSAQMKMEPGTLMAGDRGVAVERALQAQWDAVPHAVGLNNHEGSKATEDLELMKLVTSFLAEKNGYFLDSLTSARSQGRTAAKATGTRFAARRVFLDNVDKEEAVAKALDQAASIALKTGSCIAIGHPRPTTLAVLQGAAPKLRAKGLDLVAVSALARRLD